ncbi:MarR family transcriptional regulator [Nocardia panacis]|uniref:MarR family transcriptional regulator n=1 Tax=Nocardia panacis TaxID=2340916 RepID=A0A3A4K4J0_9NOCA|nr:MarR family transcriptional regulator [Nocardia panacis]RJO75233.1 MarR family transcriptional regulator [Nocardia panacis]
MSVQAATAETGADSQLWDRLLTLHTHVESRLATTMQRRHGLGLSEYRALSFLAEAAKGELRMQELADKLGLNQSSVTRLVGRLDTAELACRDLCPDDRRGVYTVLTEAGRTRYRQARTTYDDTVTAALDDLAATDPSIATLLTAIRTPHSGPR